MQVLKINERDNVVVALHDMLPGETISVGTATITLAQNVARGHKIAVCPIAANQDVVKYGFPIGHATMTINPGELVHTHNLRTNLGEVLSYEYLPQLQDSRIPEQGYTFQGYHRNDGRVGIRNEIWIIPTVSCVNRIAELVAKTAETKIGDKFRIDGIYEFKHPYGCSQMGQDQLTTQKILADLIRHPNAGGVLVLGLGCENSNVQEIQQVLGDYDPERVKFLVAQEVEDEIEAGVELIAQLASYAERVQRESCPVSTLTVGLKCGGSDGLSGITANPLVGRFSDFLVAQGGSTVLTEVPEMFGAETLLMNRAENREVFDKIGSLINDFKEYFMAYQQPIYENPSPGNKQGGISSLEDKSLGCTQKGGSSNVVDVLDYGEMVKMPGLSLLGAPGNDMVASTALAAAGCQLILFTTGRGTPLGTCVPTIKIATNSEVYGRKANWMDFDAGRLLAGTGMEELTGELWSFVLQVASGQTTKSEKIGFRDIAIFKSGVTL